MSSKESYALAGSPSSTRKLFSLRGRIRRNLQDEAMYPKIFWNVSQSERAAEVSQLRDERTRLESALFNLLKEYRELNLGK